MGYLSCHRCGVQLFDTHSTLCQSCAIQAQTEEIKKQNDRVNQENEMAQIRSGGSSGGDPTGLILGSIIASAAGVGICFWLGSILMPFIWPLGVLFNIMGIFMAIGCLMFISAFF